MNKPAPFPRPKSSATGRRRSATGRGPGRWPKGTKKTDFGNADSGPGLPPRLLKRKSKLGNEVLLGDEEGEEEDEENEEEEQNNGEEEEDDEDAIAYEKPSSSRTRSARDFGRGKEIGKPVLGAGKGKGKGKDVAGLGLGKPLLLSPGKRPAEDDAEDEEMEDAVEEDVDMDAESEDE